MAAPVCMTAKSTGCPSYDCELFKVQDRQHRCGLERQLSHLVTCPISQVPLYMYMKNLVWPKNWDM